jgi:hypothetical protein
LADINETPRPNLEAREGLVISHYGEVIVIARGHIAKVCRGQRFFGECLKLHDVQDLRGSRHRRGRLQK